MDTTVYNKEGREVGTVQLPKEIFGLPWNADLVHQVVVSMQSNARTPVAHTKDRSDVRGGGRKPWKQKGTGRARHGSRRSPIWIGGGVTFGPRNEKRYDKRINKKMRTKALYTALSQKLKEGEIIFLDSLALEAPKTKEAKTVLTSLASVPAFALLGTKKKNVALIATPERNLETERSFRNIGSVVVDEVRNLNPVDILSYKYLVLADPKKAVAFFESKPGAKVKREKAKDARPTAQKTAKKAAAVKKTAKKTARKTVKKT